MYANRTTPNHMANQKPRQKWCEGDHPCEVQTCRTTRYDSQPATRGETKRLAMRSPALGSRAFGAKIKLSPPQIAPNTLNATTHPHPASSFSSRRVDEVAKSNPKLPNSCNPTSRMNWKMRVMISSTGVPRLAADQFTLPRLGGQQNTFDEPGIDLPGHELRRVE